MKQKTDKFDFRVSFKLNDVDGFSALLKAVREAVKEYVRTEGCGCCSDYDGHKAAADKLGELLNFPRYGDDSGVDFFANDDEQKKSD